MSSIAKSSLTALRRRADDLLGLLSEKHSLEVQELRLVLEVIRQREHSTGADFAGIRSPTKAIKMCLAERGAPMLKQEILDRLVDGGFVKDPSLEKWLINDNINHGIKKGFWKCVGGADEGWGMLIDQGRAPAVPK